MNESYTFQMNEFRRLDYEFFERLAFSGDPLTYTFADNVNAMPVQVQVDTKFPKKIEGFW